MHEIQYITNGYGEKVSVIMPIELFDKLVDTSDLEDFYQPVQNGVGPSDNAKYPHEVVSIMVDKDCTVQAAWRYYRGMTQKEVATALGIKQSTVSEFEQSEHPRRENIERLAKLYGCSPEQLTFE